MSKLAVNLQCNYNQLLKAVLHNSDGLPDAETALVRGTIWYDTSDDMPYVWNGSEAVSLIGAGGTIPDPGDPIPDPPLPGDSYDDTALRAEIATRPRYLGPLDASIPVIPIVSTTPDTDLSVAHTAGDFFIVSVAGTLPSLSGASEEVEEGDLVFALTDTPTTNADFVAVGRKVTPPKLPPTVIEQQVTIADFAGDPLAGPRVYTGTYLDGQLLDVLGVHDATGEKLNPTISHLFDAEVYSVEFPDTPSATLATSIRLLVDPNPLV